MSEPDHAIAIQRTDHLLVTSSPPNAFKARKPQGNSAGTARASLTVRRGCLCGFAMCISPAPARAGEPAHTRAALIDLLRLIARRVRQLAFVILNPTQIAHIDPTAACLASEKIFRLGDKPTIGALADDRPARSRLVDVRGNCHYVTSLALDIGRPRLSVTIY